jgi:hypothetical protein
MGIIKSYRIDNNDIYLEEFLRWDWQFKNEPEDSVQIWQLKNVDKADINLDNLDSLVLYPDDCNLEEQNIGKRIRFSIFAFYDHSEFFFNCDEVIAIQRPYNTEELSKMFMHALQANKEQNDKIVKYIKACSVLDKFVDKEIDKKNRVIEQLPDISNHANLKAKHQLDTLRQLKLLLDREQQNLNSK